MKKYLIPILFLFGTVVLLSGQSMDKQISKCIMNTGSDAKYLKDFRVQLGEASNPGDFRYKANISLWKNTKYRFTMCNYDGSKGQLILSIKDDANKVILRSFDQKTGKIFPYIDFNCNRTGIYQLNYDFINGQQGSGVGVVSMVK